MVEDYVVVYVEQDMTPGTISATFVGGPLPAGFHLMKVERPDPNRPPRSEECHAALPEGTGPQEAYARCHAADGFDKLHVAEGGFDTPVTLTLAPEDELDFPNYT